MNSLDSAQKFDAADNPVEAIRNYEMALANDVVSLDVYLDLAVLYFSCCDFGYASYHHIPHEIEQNAFENSLRILSLAEKQFGLKSEIAFWKKLIHFQVLSEDFRMDDLLPLLNEKESLIPYYFAFILTGGKEYKKEARKLFGLVSERKTSRQRFIAGILEKRV